MTLNVTKKYQWKPCSSQKHSSMKTSVTLLIGACSLEMLTLKCFSVPGAITRQGAEEEAGPEKHMKTLLSTGLGVQECCSALQVQGEAERIQLPYKRRAHTYAHELKWECVSNPLGFVY